MSLQVGGAQTTTAVDDIGEALAAGIAAASCAWAATRTEARLRRGWALFAASAASWCAGEVAWSIYEVGLGTTVPSPSIADVGFIAAIPLAIVGTLTFANTPRGTSEGLRLLLDRAIVTLSLLFMGWQLGLNHALLATGGPLLPRLVSIAYPVGDILIGTVLLLSIRRATDEVQGRLLLLLAGLAANAIADSVFAYTSVSGTFIYVVDGGWVVGYLMIALAALWPSGLRDQTADEVPIDIWQLVLPWLAILAGGVTAIVLAIQGHPMDVFATLLAGSVIALLMGSQVLAHSEALSLLIKSRLSANTLKNVVAHAPLGMVRIATDMTIIDVNPSFCSILGVKADELVGARIDRFFPQSEITVVNEELRTLSNNVVDAVEMDTEGIRGDGATIWLHWTASTVRKRSDEIDYFLVMFEDVSERRSTEDALKAAYAELEGLVVQRTTELRSANARLSAEAISDPLTGLYNRRYFADFVERELSRTRRAGNKIVFVMIDIDHFKHINDTYGHDGGDQVLRTLSAFLHSQIRQEDLAFRYGGEEFLLVLPCSSLDGIAARIERIREQLTHVTFEQRRHVIPPVTLSMGVSTFPDHGDSAEVVIGLADAALYRAKEGGRDRVVYHAEAATPVLS